MLHGSGGIGKSVLASQITDRVSSLEPARRITVLSGEITAGSFLAGLAAALRRLPPAAAPSSAVAHAVRLAGRADLPWPDRLAALQAGALSRVPCARGTASTSGVPMAAWWYSRSPWSAAT